MANEFKVKNGLIVIGDLTTSGTITINGALAATQSWVASQGYLTSASLSGYATQSYVTSAISSLIDAAPAALDTLNELAAALGDDANFSTTITNSIASKQAQLNGTGLVRMSGTSVSYDNSTYLISNFGNIEGEHSYGYPSSEGWYKIAEIVLTSSCQSFNLWGEYRDTGYFDNSHYRIHITARAECDFPTNNESHAINVNMYGSSTNETYFNNNVRVVLTSSSSNYRKYELQYYRATWDTGSWNLQTLGWTTYTTSQTAGTPTGTPRVYYISKFVADNIYAANKISIGTTYSGFAANIAGTTYVIGASVWVNDGYGISNASSGGTGFFPYSDGNSVINSNNTTRLFVNGSTGNIGIGTSSPSEKLQVAGNIKIQNETGLITDYGPLIGRYNTSQIYIGTGGSYSIIKIGRDDGSALNVLSGGTIGIGTTSPVATLSVVGTVNLGAQASGFYNTNSVLHIAKSGVAQITFEDYQVTAGIAVAASVMSFGNQVSDATYRFKYNNIYNGNFASTGTTLVQFNPTTSYISAGNFGIGTTSPGANLHVNGTFISNAFWTNSASIAFWGAYDSAYGGLTWDTGQATVYATSGNKLYLASNGSSPDMTIDTSGYVGIGTTSPTGIFNISQDFSVVPFTYTLFDSYGPSTTHSPVMAQRRARGTSTSPTNVLNGDRLGFFGVMPHNGTSFPSLATGVITFVATEDHTVSASGTAFTIATTTNGVSGRTERVRVDHNGNVGIGTTTPDSALEINGRVSIRGANELYFGQSTSGLGSWTTRMYASGSTHKFNASTFIFNNEGYGGSEYMRINSAGKVSIGTTDTNSDKSDFTVYTGGNTTIALAGNLLRVGESDVNWDIALRQNGTLQTYGQTLNLNTQAGNYAVNIQPNGTTVAQFYTDYTYFPGLDFSISRVNGAHASNYFRGDASHLVIGTGGTLHLNFGNTSGNTYISGSTYVNSNLVWHAGNLTNLNQLTNGPGYIAIGSTISDTGSWTNATKFKSSGDISNAGAGNHSLQIFSDTNNDAFIAFHISGDYAVYFGLDDASNRLQTGGWSEGSNKYQIWDSRDFTSANISNWSTAYSWGNHVSAGYLRLNTWEGNSYIATSGAHYGTIFYDSNDTNYYVDPNSTSNLNVLSIPGYQYIGGQTSNGQSNYQWTGATYQTPGDWTARLILRRDNASTGVNGSIPSLVIFNNNGGDQTTASMVFASNECVTGSNSVNLAGIVAKKESVGNCGGWSSGSLNFFVKNYATRIDSLALTPDGNATFSGLVYSTGYGNSSQWNTAYSWGNHASYSYATTSYVTTQINNLINGAPGALDTLSELATALGNDASFATTVTNSIATKLPLAGGTMSGTISFINDIGTALQGTVGINDFWRIYANSTTTNAGYLEIATSDDGTEPIYVRQYTGVFSSLTRTATLLDGAGNTAFPGNLNIGGFLTESSSLKLKENIETSEGNLEKVVNLRPVTYNKIGSQTTELGLIAEEVAEVYPEFVQYDENGEPIGVNYSRLTAALIGAVKELTNQVQELNKKING